ncbi:MAG TPA: hypothetical protein VF064_07225 [Pyrinomonadaceae bacterium]
MKHLFKRTVIFLCVCALTGVAALATTLTKEVAFSRALTVNGAPVKAGTYKVTFDDQTGQLTVLDGKKVVAQAPARLDNLKGGSGYTTRTVGGSTVLIGVYMGGNNQATIINDADLPTNSSNQATILKSIGVTAP